MFKSPGYKDIILYGIESNGSTLLKKVKVAKARSVEVKVL